MRKRWLDTVHLVVLVALACLATSCDWNDGKQDGGGDGAADGDGSSCYPYCETHEDCCAGQVCQYRTCRNPDPCPSGCNAECDEALGTVCSPGSLSCLPGSPPAICLSDCDCFSGEVCALGSCLRTCAGDLDCAKGELCWDGLCRGAACYDREDCQAETRCLVCQGQRCTDEQGACARDQDCCVGRWCNFGECVDHGTACLNDTDCVDPDAPRCLEGFCQPECFQPSDCSLCEGCRDRHCVPEYSDMCEQDIDCGEDFICTCGLCMPPDPCESNADCAPPEVCNYFTRACVLPDACGSRCDPSSTFCDPFTAQCVAACSEAPSCQTLDPSSCCLPGFACIASSGRCLCSDAGCPSGSTCQPLTGACASRPCEPTCEAGAECALGVCVVPGAGLDGAPCTQDSHCDGSQGYLCDSGLFCGGCYFADPGFAPGFVCREECSLLTGDCTNPAYTCEYRHTDLKGLCVPEEVP